jgi:CelD/BcsL family acetyltransferase involved in cellulose biosynthesis
LTPDSQAGWSVVPVSGLAALVRWQEAWRAVVADAATERLFLGPEWVLPWCELLDSQPRAVFVCQHGRAQAAAILIAHRSARAGPVILRPPGLGVSDYLDLLLPSETRAARSATAVLLDWLIQAGNWDLLDFPTLPCEWPTAELLTSAAAQRGLRTLQIRTHRRPFIALNGTWESYLASRPAKLRYNLRARQRRLAKMGDMRYGHYTSPDQVTEQLGRAVEVHAQRWRGQHTSTIFSSSVRARSFYAEAIRRMAGRGWLDFSTLELDGRCLAFCLGFTVQDKFYYYLPAFDPVYARFAPSTLLLAHLIETAFARGLREFDFMLGEEPYKEQWASGARGTTRVVVAAPNLGGIAALAGFRAYLAIQERARQMPLIQRARRYGIGTLKRVLR